MLASLLVWSGVVSLLGWWPLLGRRGAMACVLCGLAVIVLTSTIYQVGLGFAITVSVLIAVLLSAWRVWQWWRPRMQPTPAA